MSTRTGRDRFTELLFYAVLVLMAYLVMLVIWPFLSPLAWAVILGLTLRPVYLHFCVRVSNGNAALLTTLLAGLLIIAPAAFLVTILSVRTRLEDRFLQAELGGYREYAARIRYRLIPGIW